jgi:cytidylate kinase
MRIAIAMDGPAASGKSTIAAEVANKLGFLYFDTGIMYRAATLAALKKNIALDDEATCSRLAQTIKVEVASASIDDGRQADVVLNGDDVTWEIRKPEVDAGVSLIASYAEVRKCMVEQQRHIATKGNMIMAGRDIGTVVLPHAPIKIFLTASVEERARRRHFELLGRGQKSNYDEVLMAMRQRDQLDSSRAVSPLRPANDAIIMNSTHLEVPQTVSILHAIISAYLQEHAKILTTS